MEVMGKLIRKHRALFGAAVFFTVLSVALNLVWNRLLAELIDRFGSLLTDRQPQRFPGALMGKAVFIVCVLAAVEYAAAALASFTCENFAHDMRMGYSRFYLQSDVRTLAGLRVGEEQSAMQNELGEISAYLNGQLFPLVKQFFSFLITTGFLLKINCRLTALVMLPVVPLILYCAVSSRVIKELTEQCQGAKRKINGLADMAVRLLPAVRIYEAEELLWGAMEERLLSWRDSSVRRERVSARLMSLSGALSLVPLLLLLGLGGSMAVKGTISMGIFYIFINLSGDVSGFLQNMPGNYAGFRRFLASVGRVKEKLW